jgi:hypothetical protein
MRKPARLSHGSYLSGNQHMDMRRITIQKTLALYTKTPPKTPPHT